MQDTGIGTRLREIRSTRGLKQVELAELMGVSQSALVAYEKGSRDPPASALITLCRSQNINPAWLLLGQKTQLRGSYESLMERAVQAAKEFTERFIAKPKSDDMMELAKDYFLYLVENEDLDRDRAELLARRRASNE